jgi:hypothetical protein
VANEVSSVPLIYSFNLFDAVPCVESATTTTEYQAE